MNNGSHDRPEKNQRDARLKIASSRRTRPASSCLRLDPRSCHAEGCRRWRTVVRCAHHRTGRRFLPSSARATSLIPGNSPLPRRPAQSLIGFRRRSSLRSARGREIQWIGSRRRRWRARSVERQTHRMGTRHRRTCNEILSDGGTGGQHRGEHDASGEKALQVLRFHVISFLRWPP
jgi:hypothetical protein